MEKRTKIVIDTKGADKGAEMMIKGAAMALSEYPTLELCLVGDAELIATELKAHGADEARVEIIDAPDEITNYDSPGAAVFGKPESSLVRALAALSEREDLAGLINAGSTGALIAGSMRYLSLKERVRPALAAVLPAESGGFTCLVDTGATIDCPPALLVHFAHLGSAFMKEYYGIESPGVALLSNGAEPTKGNAAVKEAHQLLAADESIRFVGNLEGNSALSGAADVLVADGFAGNQVLKCSEGMARRLITDIVKYARKTGDENIMKLVGHLMSVYDFNSLGGGIILGISKPVIKAHGAANEKTVVSVIGMMMRMLENKQVYDRDSFAIS